MRNGRKKRCRYRFRSPLHSTAVLNLNCSLVFSSSRSFMFFWRPKERKAPAHLKPSPPFLCSGVAGRHPSVKKVLPLEPFCWFLGDADLPQLVTRQGEHLTSGRTFTSCKFCCTRCACKQVSARSLARIILSLIPKITRVQVVSFNGAGFTWHYHCTR